MKLDTAPCLDALKPKLARLFELAAAKAVALDRSWEPSRGTPVLTVEGRYTTRGWTEWTAGFQFGCPLLVFDATGDGAMLDLGRSRTLERMAPLLTHTGAHDHGFNILSTYGNLRRLAREGRTDDAGRLDLYELALKVSGAVQAMRWTPIRDERDVAGTGPGFVHSFNGPHSLFADTIRSMRSLCLGWQLGHVLVGENDERIDLLGRAVAHLRATARYTVYYGDGRDGYDTPAEAGRTAHESIFNVTDGRYRCPSTQQGYSPFSTWTRGLAWVLAGFAEQLEFLHSLSDAEVDAAVGDGGVSRGELLGTFRRAAEAAAEWYLRHSFTDGMVYWDAGAPGIPRGGVDYGAGPSDPYNDHEPIDSSAAAIAGQGFLRLGDHLAAAGKGEKADRYHAAARTIAGTLFDEPYLSTDAAHQGLVLHSIYHRPRGWDRIPPGRAVPCDESSLWGDYHALELALLLHRRAESGPGVTFFDRRGG